MNFYILTLFPEVLKSYLKSSIIGRSIKEKKINVVLINFRDYATDKHKRVDDTAYGGGPGMLLKCEPIYKAINAVKSNDSKIIFLTPTGKPFNQKKATGLAQEKELILVCGFYEGFDSRLFELFEHEKISIGDYVLTNGGLSALVLLDAVTRIKEQVLYNPESLKEESFNNGLLEYNQYTKPCDFLNLKVPDVLLSGHHKKIEDFRHKSSLINTLNNRPELIENAILTNKDLEFLTHYIEEKKNDY